MSLTDTQLQDRYVVRNVVGMLGLIRQDPVTLVSFCFLMFVIFLGVFGPMIAPYGADERVYGPDGEVMIAEPPSAAHPLGTTDISHDVFSKILHGARPTVVAGLIGGSMIITIGTTIGATAGYVGGYVDNVLMRFTDFVYGVPLLPFAIVLVGLFGVGYFQSIIVIGLILWRGSARVIRSQVLQIKERPYILSAKASGASTTRILVKHILPNIAPMALLFFAIGVGYTIIIQAGLSFLGVANPYIPSWGVIIRNAYSSGRMITAWWWSIAPGLMLSFTVMATFMFGRGYEKLIGSDSNESALTQ
ncbi:ABC transporter permease [Haloarcula marina]|uniref:ABC transporter permease n=1 Tax=Haloarcula marina TaxID=2961574 RepID=UPI0020B6D1EB|nr:ABC transporter permease [Halomicroarcula marina]